ncbi:S-antigen protein [Liparis tanakae]|uniref:S-antigen protein n=1 Tax=Liparis tanakae TaxID=230148 RepID=A0A4Z2E7J5_9TELE|nr:S-antigen protein [Liparis tanakae]
MAPPITEEEVCIKDGGNTTKRQRDRGTESRREGEKERRREGEKEEAAASFMFSGDGSTGPPAGDLIIAPPPMCFLTSQESSRAVQLISETSNQRKRSGVEPAGGGRSESGPSPGLRCPGHVTRSASSSCSAYLHDIISSETYSQRGTEEEQKRNRGGTEEEQKRNRGGTEEEQKRNRGGTEEEQQRNRRGTEEEQRRNRRGTEEEQKRNRGGTEEEQKRNRRGTEEEQRRNRRGTAEEQKRNSRGTEEEQKRNRGGTETT